MDNEKSMDMQLLDESGKVILDGEDVWKLKIKM